MAKTVLGVSDKLKQLYQLQLIDSNIDEIQVLKGELPIEVSDLEDEIQGLDTRTKKLQERIDDVNKEILAHEANINTANTLIARYEKQLDEVKNNREFEALTKEIELQKLEIQLSEKKKGEASLQKETKEVTLNESKEKLETKNQNLAVKKVELEKIIEKTNVDEQKLKKISDKAQNSIEERLLKSYKRIRRSYRNGLAVVTVKRDSCGGCFNRIPPQLQIEIGLYKNIVACEHCGRVLIDEDLAATLDDKYSKVR